MPALFMIRLTAHDNINALFEDCKYYNLKILNEKLHLNFQRNDFNRNVAILKCKHEQYVEHKLKDIFLPEILLMKKIDRNNL